MRRSLFLSEPFERAISNATMDAIQAKPKQALADIGGALQGVKWKHANGDSAEYSLHGAADLVAALANSGTGADFAIDRRTAQTVPVWLSDRMLALGWSPTISTGLWDCDIEGFPFERESDIPK